MPRSTGCLGRRVNKIRAIASCANIAFMTSTTEKVVSALELLPEDMREPAVAYLLEEAEKYRALKALIAEGLDDIEQGRVSEWSFEGFLCEARALEPER
jgi:hypothetical protein